MRFSKRTKLMCLFLCLIMLLSALLTACDGGTEGEGGEESTGAPTTAAPSDQEKPTSIEGWLPINDYGVDGGAGEVKLVTYTNYNTNYMFIQNTDSEDPLRAAAYSRTQRVGELYNVAFTPVEVADVTSSIQSSVMGGTCEFDIVYPQPGSVYDLTVNNLVSDLYSYENIHLDQPWWNKSVETFTVDNHLYFAAADFSICGQGLTCLIYNRPLWNTLQLPYDLTAMVYNYEWTMDKLREIVMQYGKDLDGDDKYTLNDAYGMIYQLYHTNSYYWSMGGKIVTYDKANDEYQMAIDVDLTSKMATSLYRLMWDSDNKVYAMPKVTWSNFATSEGWKAYKNGNSLFMSYEVGALFRHLQEVTFELGYLPNPKLTVEQTEYPALCGAGFFMLPRKTVDPLRNSIILEALCIESYVSFRPAFIRTILLGRLSNVEEDYDMLNYLHESKTYDMGYTWSRGGSNSILEMVADPTQKSTNVASLIKGRKKDMSQTLDIIEEMRSGIYSENQD